MRMLYMVRVVVNNIMVIVYFVGDNCECMEVIVWCYVIWFVERGIYCYLVGDLVFKIIWVMVDWSWGYIILVFLRKICNEGIELIFFEGKIGERY